MITSTAVGWQMILLLQHDWKEVGVILSLLENCETLFFMIPLTVASFHNFQVKRQKIYQAKHEGQVFTSRVDTGIKEAATATNLVTQGGT